MSSFNSRILQVLLLGIIILLLILIIKELYVFLPGLLGAFTLYILSRENYFQLVYNKKWKRGWAAMLFAAGIGIDLMFGVPGQSPDDMRRDMEEALRAEPDHLSWYELELKPGSALARRNVAPVDEDEAADAYRWLVGHLEGSCYRWYETANFARPGHECRHSLAYWNAADYLGVGVGAVSTIAGRRWRNSPGLARYIDALAGAGEPPRTGERLDADDIRRERWMLGLRLERGLRTAWAGPPDHPDAMARLERAGLLSHDDDAVVLTREGRFVQNAILHELMEFA